ncbi:hypothetical protein [Clostridium sp. DJ247]|uniref:hypothetical protein n=1 Tax=Clostridium sp. DJ247 TaxID=2726188 RepID=UPI00162AA95A|nr:hypothetical protein [Clostridium sp. DJ247]MBC2581219.1 hypothetical protein [Clostridium sp. DJ247]
MKKNYKMKRTISIKQFIAEFGENFSKHMKKRLLELEVRTVLVRREHSYILDLKHVEHTKYCCNLDDCSVKQEKEYAYGQFIVIDGILYFSERCMENNEVMQAPIVNTIYSHLDSENIILDEENSGKVIDDSNIDFVIDNILTVCPEVSEAYMNIVQEMISRSETKSKNTVYSKVYK